MASDRSAHGVVRAKIAPPALHEPVLVRPRVEQRVRDGLQRPLLLVAADAGFGKTTAVTSALRARGDVAWYRLDASDSDPAVFAHYALAALGAGSSRPLGHMGSGGWPQAVRVILREWEQRPKVHILAVDDVHLIEQAEVSEAFAFFVEHLPAHAHLVIASRTVPALPLARWRVRGVVAEIGPNDLRFSPAELRSLLVELNRLHLSDPALHVLAARTEGWAAGIALALHTLRTLGAEEATGEIARLSGSSRAVYDYLANETFERHPDDIKQFLRATSMLPRFDAALAAELVGVADSRATLRYLERSGLFLVSLDDERRWFRYHHLFQEFLQRRLTEDTPGMVQPLRRRAGELWEARGETAQAIAYYLAARDYDRAARLIGSFASEAFSRGWFETMREWFEQLPEATVAAHPRVALARGMLNVVRGTSERAITDLRAARRGLRASGDAAGEAEAIRWLAMELFGVGALEELLALERELSQDVGRFPPAPRTFVLEALHRAPLSQGDFERALALLTEAAELARAVAEPRCEANALSYRGMVRRVRGDTQGALADFASALATARSEGATHWEAHYLTEMADTYLEDGRIAEAAAAADRARPMADDVPCRVLNRHLAAVRGRLALARGEVDDAEASFTESMAIGQEIVVHHRPDPLIGLAMCAVRRGDAPTAIRHLSTCLHSLRVAHRAFASLHLGMLSSNRRLVESAAALFARMGTLHADALVALAHAQCAHDAGERDAALRWLSRVTPSPWLAAHLAWTWAPPVLVALGERAGLGQLLQDARRHVAVRIYALGPFRARVGDRAIDAWPRRSARAALQYLAIHRRAVSREEVAEALWPDHDPRHAATSFKVALSTLRQALRGFEHVVLTTGQGALHLAAGVWVDVHAFEDAVAAAARTTGDARRRWLERAVSLYHGDLFADEPALDWAASARRRLQESYRRALAGLATLHEAAAEWEQALARWRVLVEIDALDEIAYQGLIRASLALGRRTDAVRALDECRAVLRRELDVEPSPDTLALLQEAVTSL